MADNILTRKIGPLPGWAWGAGALVVGLGYFYFSSRSSSSTSGAAGSTSGGSMVNNPAASSIPYVPSVTVTGIPSTQPSSVSTPSSSSTCGTPDTPINRADWVPFGGGWWYKPGGSDAPFIKSCMQYSRLNDPTAAAAYKSSGGQIYFFVQPGVPVPGEIGAQYAATPVATGGGGQGGWGQAGQANPVAFWGWTSWGPSAGGQGGGHGASGASARTSRAGAPKPVKPLKRRMLSGR